VAATDARISDLEAGSLPPVCAKTGGPADGFTKVEFSSTPGWMLILLLFGIIPFLIAQAFASVRVDGLIPLSTIAQRRITMFNRLFVGLVVLSLGVIVLGFMTEQGLILWGLAMLLGAIIVMLIGRAFVLPSGQVKDEWVRLSFVDVRFATELYRFYGRER
jgi:hypothetical protein